MKNNEKKITSQKLQSLINLQKEDPNFLDKLRLLPYYTTLKEIERFVEKLKNTDSKSPVLELLKTYTIFSSASYKSLLGDNFLKVLPLLIEHNIMEKQDFIDYLSSVKVIYNSTSDSLGNKFIREVYSIFEKLKPSMPLIPSPQENKNQVKVEDKIVETKKIDRKKELDELLESLSNSTDSGKSSNTPTSSSKEKINNTRSQISKIKPPTNYPQQQNEMNTNEEIFKKLKPSMPLIPSPQKNNNQVKVEDKIVETKKIDRKKEIYDPLESLSISTESGKSSNTPTSSSKEKISKTEPQTHYPQQQNETNTNEVKGLGEKSFQELFDELDL